MVSYCATWTKSENGTCTDKLLSAAEETGWEEVLLFLRHKGKWNEETGSVPDVNTQPADGTWESWVCVLPTLLPTATQLCWGQKWDSSFLLVLFLGTWRRKPSCIVYNSVTNRSHKVSGWDWKGPLGPSGLTPAPAGAPRAGSPGPYPGVLWSSPRRRLHSL